MMGNKYYTGIGSRKTPETYLSVMRLIAHQFVKKGFILRSGGADGADSIFEFGCDEKNGKKEIYLPWKNYNNNNSSYYDYFNFDKAFEIASDYHPKWNNLSIGVKKLLARNVYQLLGLDLNTPSEVVIAYHENKGGTFHTCKMAKDFGIEVINLKFDYRKEI